VASLFSGSCDYAKLRVTPHAFATASDVLKRIRHQQPAGSVCRRMDYHASTGHGAEARHRCK
jgi:hypothetical protein